MKPIPFKHWLRRHLGLPGQRPQRTGRQDPAGQGIFMTTGEYQLITGKIRVLAEQPGVTEVFCNDWKTTGIIRDGRIAPHAPLFRDAAQLLAYVLELSYRSSSRLDGAHGSAGGILECGTLRWHAVLPPLSRDGVILSLRCHRFGRISINDFEVGEGDATTLLKIMNNREPLLVCGPTGSGKTSLLATLLAETAAAERIIVIESTPELPLPNQWSLRLTEQPANPEGKGRVTSTDLIRECLRLRPDRIVVGEIRGLELTAFFDAINTGHGGAMASIHCGEGDAPEQRIRSLLPRWAAAGSFPTDRIWCAVMRRGSRPAIRTVRPLEVLQCP